MIYVAVFDEVDEGTDEFKVAEVASSVPAGIDGPAGRGWIRHAVTQIPKASSNDDPEFEVSVRRREFENRSSG